MIKARNIQVFPNGELPNDDYHGEKYADHVSGSMLAMVHEDCPAAVKFGEPSESAALHFGTASHAAFLEPELFDKGFVCGIHHDNYPDACKTDAEIKAALKAAGIKGYSSLSGWSLAAEAYDKLDSFESLKVLEECQYAEAKKNNQTIVKKEDFDTIKKMRNVLFAEDSISEIMRGAAIETSVICEIEIDDQWHKVKIRPDIITKNCMVPDYKTTRSAAPEAFGRQAHNAGYWLKQAFVVDVLSAVYGTEFKAALIAQSKTPPYIHQGYLITKDQYNVGREQYMQALKYWAWCQENNTYPGYGGGFIDLPTPGYIAKQYGFEG